MKKIITIILLILTLFANNVFVFANELANNNPLKIEIISPSSVKDYPGREETVIAKITNNTNFKTGELLAYITMADVNKNMTVNLEDYSADKPVLIHELNANESKIIELPVRFVYTSSYHLYVTVAYKESDIIVSSLSIPIEILGNTMIDKNMVIAVAGVEPIVLLGIVCFIYFKRKQKFKIS